MPRKKSKKKWYFTQESEDIIVEYANETDQDRRNKLYSETISPLFDDLINKVVNTYKFNSLPNLEERKADCASHMSMILNKFDPNKGAKAFSYFTVVIKNWFFAEKKKHYKRVKEELQYEDISIVDDEGLYTENEFEDIREKEEFWEHLLQEFSYWEEDLSNCASDLKVYRAIVLLFDYVGELDIFNRRAAYEYIRKITGLKTEEISEAIKKLKENYGEFKNSWDSGEI